MIRALGRVVAPRGRRRVAVLVVAGLMASGIFASRLAISNPADGVGALYVLPIVLVAVELGIVPGLVSAALAFALTGAWIAIDNVDLTVLGYLSRALVYFPVAALAGFGADRLRAAIEASDRTEKLVRRIVESASDAHVSTDEVGTIVAWNPAAERMFGWTAEEAIGAPATIVIPRRHRAAYLEGLRAFRDGDRSAIGTRSDFRGIDRVGREFPVEMSVSALKADGRWTLNASIHDVSERRREEASRRRLAAIVESSDDAIFSYTLDGRILTWNASAERIFGYTGAEAVGMPIAALTARDRPDEIGPLLELVRRGERATNFHTVCATKGGRRLHVALSVSPITDESGAVLAVSSIARDISARVLTEAYIAAEHQAARVLASASSSSEVCPAILPIVGEGGRWLCGVYWAAEDDGGRLRCHGVWTAPEIRVPLRPAEIGDDCELRRGSELPEWHAGDPATMSLPRAERAAELGMKTQLWIPIAAGDELLGAFQLFDRRLRERNDELVAVMTSIASLVGNYFRRRRAEAEVERAKDEFFALVSHELRTPLTSIIGYTDLVAEVDADRLSDEARGFLDVIRRNADREMHLVSDLLLLVKIQEGTFTVERDGRADLERIVAESVEAARPAAERREIRLEAAFDPPPPCAGDAHRLGQVVDNLLSNAIKFTPRGGRVAVRLGSRNGAAAIEVADNGIGVPEDERERLFDRLYRARGAASARVPGLGLGLTIVKAIVEAHGGTVAVESSQGPGTTFRVEVPILESMRPPG